MFSKLKLPSRIAHNIIQCLKIRTISSIQNDVIRSASKNSPCESKVTVVGCEDTGISCAANIAELVNCSICVLAEKTEDLKLLSELQQESLFQNNARITGSTNYADTACSKVCIITSHFRETDGETLPDSIQENIQKNADIVKDIVKKLVVINPNTILLIVTNPVDIMSYVAWKTSKFPHKRVIGIGTCFETACARNCIGEIKGVAPSSVDMFVIGTPGELGVPVWSGANIAGMILEEDSFPTCKVENWFTRRNKPSQIPVEEQYIAVARGVAYVTAAIMGNKRQVISVSTMVANYACIREETYLSLPCVLGCNGIERVITPKLSIKERIQLLESLHSSLLLQKDINI